MEAERYMRAACEPTALDNVALQTAIALALDTGVTRLCAQVHIRQVLVWLQSVVERHGTNSAAAQAVLNCFIDLAFHAEHFPALEAVMIAPVRKLLLQHVDDAVVACRCLWAYSNLTAKGSVRELVCMPLEQARWLVRVAERHCGDGSIASPVEVKFVGLLHNMSYHYADATVTSNLTTSDAMRVLLKHVTVIMDRVDGCVRGDCMKTLLNICRHAPQASGSWLLETVLTPVITTTCAKAVSVDVVALGCRVLYFMSVNLCETSFILSAAFADKVVPVVWRLLTTFGADVVVAKYCVGVLNSVQTALPSDINTQPESCLELLHAALRRHMDDSDFVTQCISVFAWMPDRFWPAKYAVFDDVKAAVVRHGQRESVVAESVIYFFQMSRRKSGCDLARLWDVKPLMDEAALKLEDGVLVLRCVGFYCNLAQLDLEQPQHDAARCASLISNTTCVASVLRRYVDSKFAYRCWLFLGMTANLVGNADTEQWWCLVLGLFTTTMTASSVHLRTLQECLQCMVSGLTKPVWKDACPWVLAAVWRAVVAWLPPLAKLLGASHVAESTIPLCDLLVALTEGTEGTEGTVRPAVYMALVMDTLHGCMAAQGASNRVARQCAACVHTVVRTHLCCATTAAPLLQQVLTLHGGDAVAVQHCLAAGRLMAGVPACRSAVIAYLLPAVARLPITAATEDFYRALHGSSGGDVEDVEVACSPRKHAKTL
jgi:hypothetical protein